MYRLVELPSEEMVHLRKSAKKSLKYIRSMIKMGSLDDYLSGHSVRITSNLDADNLSFVHQLYNVLFEKIVLKKHPELLPCKNAAADAYYVSRCMAMPNGKKVMVGSIGNHYPFVLNATELVADLEAELTLV
jgi:hypothetical protein